MDFFSGGASFLTESSITLDRRDTELCTWEFWIALSTVMFMIPCEDMAAAMAAGAAELGGPAEEEGAGCGKYGRESGPGPGGGRGPRSAIRDLSISELMCWAAKDLSRGSEAVASRD